MMSLYRETDERSRRTDERGRQEAAKRVQELAHVPAYVGEEKTADAGAGA